MARRQFVTVIGTVLGLAGAGVLAAGSSRLSVLAHDEHGSDDESRIEQGLRIAPVHLTYSHRNRLVGLGSYLVNAVGECNGCHCAGPPTAYAAGHNPYFRAGIFTPPKAVNPATYLGGGSDFGQIQPGPSPHIVSRNLTPDKSGLPEGGATFAEFYESIRHGIDADHAHPNCSTTITTNCFNAPFNGDLLQVMPWPAYQDWTDHDLLAVYEYLKAIPCVAGAGHECH